MINWFRALNHMTFHNDQFPNFNTERFWIIDNLTKYDDTGLLGTMIIPLNYFLISTSKHPFLIHMNQKDHRIERINLAFMMGLISYFFPSVFFFFICFFSKLFFFIL